MKLLLLDDDELLLKTMQRRFSQLGHQVWSFSRLPAWPELRVIEPDGCLVDLRFGSDSGLQLLEPLRREFPHAALAQVDAGRDAFLAPRVQAVADALAGGEARVPLDLVGTAFQKRVWDALMKIPTGEVRSYTAVAEGLGAPSAARAVASACARNRVAILVPCHRVVRGDGSLGGYRWGLDRKRLLIARERANTVAEPARGRA